MQLMTKTPSPEGGGVLDFCDGMVRRRMAIELGGNPRTVHRFGHFGT